MREIRRGRPVIALIEDSPGRYHYVVIVGWESGTVTVHDPARAPSRALPAARFEAEWEALRAVDVDRAAAAVAGHAGRTRGRTGRS